MYAANLKRRKWFKRNAGELSSNSNKVNPVMTSGRGHSDSAFKFYFSVNLYDILIFYPFTNEASGLLLLISEYPVLKYAFACVNFLSLGSQVFSA